MRKIFAALVGLLVTVSASADEVWRSDRGDIIYLADHPTGAAILSAPELNPAGEMRFYFPGLAGNFDNRSVHHGHWLIPGDAARRSCGAELTGVDGASGDRWGSVTLVFHSDGFPSDLTLLIGECFHPPKNMVRALAVVG